jgi:hypothetical protein
MAASYLDHDLLNLLSQLVRIVLSLLLALP